MGGRTIILFERAPFSTPGVAGRLSIGSSDTSSEAPQQDLRVENFRAEIRIGVHRLFGEKPSISTSRRTFRRRASPNATCDVGVERAARRGSRRRSRRRAARPRVAKGFRAPDEKHESGAGVATATPTPGVVVAARATRRRSRLVERYAFAIFESSLDEGLTGFVVKHPLFGPSDTRFDAGRRRSTFDRHVRHVVGRASSRST